jgi:hypothetical protein
MNVEEMIAELEKIEDKTLDVRVIQEKDDGEENYWASHVEVSNQGDSGYNIFGEVRIVGTE